MMLRYHGLPSDVFDAVADGCGGVRAIGALAKAQYSKRLLLLHGVVDAAGGAGRHQAARARRGYELLEVVQAHDPGAADVVIRYPTVGAWAGRTLRGLRTGAAEPGADPARLCAVAAAAAIQAGWPTGITVPVLRGIVALPSLGAAAADGYSALLRISPGGTRVVSAGRRVRVPDDPYRDAPGWTGLRRVPLGAGGVLMDDVDPFRMPAATQLRERLSAAEAASWSETFRRAWGLLDRYHPDTAAEVAAAVRLIVPLNTPPRGLVSSSSPETFGAVALSEPVGATSLAATLAHEVQHLKLSALIDVVPLTLPDSGRRFYAPWRPDPRPISGLLQGAYAYLGVTRFWRRQRLLEEGVAGTRAHTEFARWRDATSHAIRALLGSGLLSPSGLTFVKRMEGSLDTWAADWIPAGAQALAQAQAENHRRRWRSENSGFTFS